MAAALHMYSKLFSERKRPLGEDFWCRGSMVTKCQLLESENLAIPVCAAVAALGATRGDEKARSPNEERNQQWWDDGFNNWRDDQFKKRLRVIRETFTFLLDSVVDDIRKETTRFKKPTSPERQLNTYFVSVGETLADKLPASDIDPLVYIQSSFLNSFVFRGICECEVYDKIMNLKVEKSTISIPENVSNLPPIIFMKP